MSFLFFFTAIRVMMTLTPAVNVCHSSSCSLSSSRLSLLALLYILKSKAATRSTSCQGVATSD